jgi:transcriptional regulator of acetoin/glycerol metabolism
MSSSGRPSSTPSSAHGHKSRATALLGLTRVQLYTRLKRHQIAATPE